MSTSDSILEPHQLIDRELSWLDFNTRVLELAEDTTLPLLERVRFLSIFSSNLDDFFMIRVASVKLKIESGATYTNVAGYSPNALLEEITMKASALVERQTRCLHEVLIPALSEKHIDFVHWEELSSEEQVYLREFFETKIFPVLTPLAVDPSHPFPYISGLSLSLAVIVKHPITQEEFFARVKVPNLFPRYLPTSQILKNRFILLEDVIAAHLQELFPSMTIEDYYTFRLTRNEDLDIEEDEIDNILETMEQELLRRKFGPPVRLEVETDIKHDLLERLVSELEITDRDVVKYQGPLDLTGLNVIADLEQFELRYPKLRSVVPKNFTEIDATDYETFFEAIRQSEILLHHPYESFSSSVVRFIETAAVDPKVLAIKQTLYRTSGDSPIMEALIEAAQTGKQVLAVVEIRARFDELANVKWARKLEEAGVHVVYGLMGLKTHAKLSLVVRKEEESLRSYCHVGTGNYNPKTARLYEDLGILSSDPILCDDVTRLFNQLSGFISDSKFNRLIVAPKSMRFVLQEKISREVHFAKEGKPAKIRLKLNSLLDEEFVASLYKASQAGVDIEIFVRGICALRPGIPNLSENITVRSFLGRFLEHSRIYHFHNGGEDEIWIGSADLMHRNLDRRVETLVKLDNYRHREQVLELLDMYSSPGSAHWELNPFGKWNRITMGRNFEPLTDVQERLMEAIHERR
jgi:polyphosphate kinase